MVGEITPININQERVAPLTDEQLKEIQIKQMRRSQRATVQLQRAQIDYDREVAVLNHQFSMMKRENRLISLS
ncbi:MAG: hypothetical protein KGO93_08750 [Cyanobacteria bacterium REEB446]|nr:hypothetical protein [Cyanobacteria bacterium REEB446]